MNKKIREAFNLLSEMLAFNKRIMYKVELYTKFIYIHTYIQSRKQHRVFYIYTDNIKCKSYRKYLSQLKSYCIEY